MRQRSSLRPQKSPSSTLPIVKINRRAALRLRAGHPWVYRSDLIPTEEIEPGALVSIADEQQRVLGSGLYSSSSQIALRLLSSREIAEADLPALIADRVRSALHYRERLEIQKSANAYRLVFSEADQIPGLIADRYNDVITVQFLTQAMDRPELRKSVLDVLVEELSPQAVVERVEPHLRELEQLPPIPGGLLYGEKTRTMIEMNGLSFAYDAAAGQKTGAFLDQRENYAAAAQFAGGRALDVFCYQGGFALHLARVCVEVTGVDASRPALEQADANAALNKERLPQSPEWIEANAFDLLRDYSDAGEKYDTIVLDPPAFAKSKRALPTALRGYKELNLRALKMLNPGGLLVTCSCSHHVSQQDFLEMLHNAATDARRRLRLVEVRGQGKDHPVIAGIPETAYLKCVIAIAD